MTVESELQQMNANLTRFLSQQSAYQQQSYDAIRNNLRLYNASLTDTVHLTKRQEKITKKATEYKEKELEAIRNRKEAERRLAREQQALQDEIANGTLTEDARREYQRNIEYYTRVRDNSARQEQSAVKKRLQQEAKLHSSTSRVIDSFNKIGDAADDAMDLFGRLGKLATVVKVVIKQGTEYIKVARHVSEEFGGMMEGPTFDQSMFDFTSEMVKRSLDSKQMSEALMPLRQVTNTLEGGYREALDTVRSVAEEQSMRYGGDRNKATMEELKLFQKLNNFGFKPTTKSLQKFHDNMDLLSGYGVKNAQESLLELASDIDSISILKNARMEEREAILQNQAALLAFNHSLGMGEEQAKEAAKSLQKLAAEKPLDRFKKAVKFQVLASALGMPEQGAAYFEEQMKPKGQQDYQRMMAAQVGITNKVDTLEQDYGSIESTPFYQMIDKLGLGGMVDENSQFSTTLVQHLANSVEEVKNSYVNATGSTVKTLSDVMHHLEMLQQAIENGTLMVTVANELGLMSHLVNTDLANVNTTLTDAIRTLTDTIKNLFNFEFTNPIDAIDRSFANMLGDFYESALGKDSSIAQSYRKYAESLKSEKEKQRERDAVPVATTKELEQKQKELDSLKAHVAELKKKPDTELSSSQVQDQKDKIKRLEDSIKNKESELDSMKKRASESSTDPNKPNSERSKQANDDIDRLKKQLDEAKKKISESQLPMDKKDSEAKEDTKSKEENAEIARLKKELEEAKQKDVSLPMSQPQQPKTEDKEPKSMDSEEDDKAELRELVALTKKLVSHATIQDQQMLSQTTTLQQTTEQLKNLNKTSETIQEINLKQLAALTMSNEERTKYSDYLRRSGSSSLQAEYATVN